MPRRQFAGSSTLPPRSPPTADPLASVGLRVGQANAYPTAPPASPMFDRYHDARARTAAFERSNRRSRHGHRRAGDNAAKDGEDGEVARIRSEERLDAGLMVGRG